MPGIRGIIGAFGIIGIAGGLPFSPGKYSAGISPGASG
jgi:hypothetical protein